jgi:hypothetical protein
MQLPEGGTVWDRLERNILDKVGRFAEGGREAARRPWRHLQQGAVPLHRAVRPGLGVGNSGGQADDELICSGHIDRTVVENDSTRIHLGVSVLRALGTLACARMSMKPMKPKRATTRD